MTTLSSFVTSNDDGGVTEGLPVIDRTFDLGALLAQKSHFAPQTGTMFRFGRQLPEAARRPPGHRQLLALGQRLERLAEEFNSSIGETDWSSSARFRAPGCGRGRRQTEALIRAGFRRPSRPLCGLCSAVALLVPDLVLCRQDAAPRGVLEVAGRTPEHLADQLTKLSIARGVNLIVAVPATWRSRRPRCP